MALKEKKEKKLVLKTAAEVIDFDPTPADKKLKVVRFGVADTADPKEKPIVAVLEFGNGGSFEFIRAICVAGGTAQLLVDKQFQGDGTKFLRLTLTNPTNNDRDVFYWVDNVEIS